MKQQVFTPADILLPKGGCDLAWPTIACDQFTSDSEYWKEVARLTAGKPSTYHMVLPERYLTESPDEIDRRMEGIRNTMQTAAQSGMTVLPGSMIYLERKLGGGGLRRGIIGKVDLECYSYNRDAATPIRATEETVVDRLPPRIRIRRQAALELPHMLLLFSDEKDTLLGMLQNAKADMEQVYNTPLMQQSGHVTGYRLTTELLAKVDEFFTLRQQENPLMFLVGDGNHSLAAAKACYEELKESIGAEAAANHPMRYALAEIVRLEESSLEFEPIYRVVTGCDTAKLTRAFCEECHAEARTAVGEETEITIVTKEGAVTYACPIPPHTLPVQTLQPFLDQFLKENGGETDYIHGVDAVTAAGKTEHAAAFVFRGMEKGDLFPAVAAGGVLPRKTFSMGEGRDKRFYLEARAIR